MTNKNFLKVIPFKIFDNSEGFFSAKLDELTPMQEALDTLLTVSTEKDNEKYSKEFDKFIPLVRKIIEKNNINILEKMRGSQILLFEPKPSVTLENGTISGLSKDEILGDNNSSNLIVKEIRELISENTSFTSFCVDSDSFGKQIIIGSDESADPIFSRYKNPKIYNSDSDEGYKKGNSDGLDEEPGAMYKIN